MEMVSPMTVLFFHPTIWPQIILFHLGQPPARFHSTSNRLNSTDGAENKKITPKVNR